MPSSTPEKNREHVNTHRARMREAGYVLLSNVWIPQALHKAIVRRARQENKPIWVVVAEALAKAFSEA